MLCLLSLSGGSKTAEQPIELINQQLVLGNQVVFGSVNANTAFRDGREGLCGNRKEMAGRAEAAHHDTAAVGSVQHLVRGERIGDQDDAGDLMKVVQIPDDMEEHRDERWRREGDAAGGDRPRGRAIYRGGRLRRRLHRFPAAGPSLYVAVCGRRDAVLPRNVQKDPETSLTWLLKDEIMGRGNVYYAKLARGKTMFLAPRMIPYFHAVWGMRRTEEKQRLSRHAQAILKVLRKEWEMATADLREESGVNDRAAFTRAMDELQAAMIVVPSAAAYVPKFTYIWTLGIDRFPDELVRRVSPPPRCGKSRAAFSPARA